METDEVDEDLEQEVELEQDQERRGDCISAASDKEKRLQNRLLVEGLPILPDDLIAPKRRRLLSPTNATEKDDEEEADMNEADNQDIDDHVHRLRFRRSRHHHYHHHYHQQNQLRRRASGSEEGEAEQLPANSPGSGKPLQMTQTNKVLDVMESSNGSKSTSESPPSSIPKLRLNALLASDPALMPDAKDLKLIQEEAQNNQQLMKNAPMASEKNVPVTEANSAVEAFSPILKSGGNQEALVTTAPTATAASKMSASLGTAELAATPQRLKVFMCLPCGIGFSSPSTLEAHQAYYCSHR